MPKLTKEHIDLKVDTHCYLCGANVAVDEVYEQCSTGEPGIMKHEACQKEADKRAAERLRLEQEAIEKAKAADITKAKAAAKAKAEAEEAAKKSAKEK